MSNAQVDALITRYQALRLPPMVILDITNTCNLACVHCPQPLLQRRPDFVRKHLEWDHFTKVADEIGAIGQPLLLRFAGDGEPTVHPRLFDMIAYAKRNTPATVNLTTNGILMTAPRIDSLLEVGVDLIDISIDAFRPETYQAIRRGGNFARLMENIDLLLTKRAAVAPATKVMVSLVQQAENEGETEDFRAHWQSRVDYVMIRQLHSAVGAISSAKVEESSVRNDANHQTRHPCPHLWKRLTVDFTGAIKFCAHEWLGNQDVILGHMDAMGLEQAWTSDTMRRVRDMQVTDQYPDGFICKTCTDWASSRWDQGYERLVDRVVHKAPILYPEL